MYEQSVIAYWRNRAEEAEKTLTFQMRVNAALLKGNELLSDDHGIPVGEGETIASERAAALSAIRDLEAALCIAQEANDALQRKLEWYENSPKEDLRCKAKHSLNGSRCTHYEGHSGDHEDYFEHKWKRVVDKYHPLHENYVGHNEAKARGKAFCICNPPSVHILCPFHGR